ncbi:endo alpha-1,4 polygalactosaminidase [Aquipuribacter hungaricus]|uniref:Endo alpha-1,4 polygalactosaminidase n=1 Tax=Aquipuribacter hungaricus TaxID=545624 RepID=A0ABV7WGS1_9MICO
MGTAGARGAAARVLPALTVLLLLLAAGALAGCGDPDEVGPPVALPPAGARLDYQLGGDHDPVPGEGPPGGVGVVVRDWHDGRPLPGAYSVCYVNAFQTQPDGDGTRPDERSAWPAHLLLGGLGEDPGWPGELLVDISTAARRAEAAAWLAPVLQTCADRGFDAVELDNLDSWTRFDGTPEQGRVPFGRDDAVAHAALLADRAHALGLAVAQKNTPQLTRYEARDVVGFDLAVAEECGRYRECGAYTALYGGAVLVVEYDDEGMARACDEVGTEVPVVRRDVGLSVPTSGSYVRRWCDDVSP